jgi:hypothetical protein
LIKSTKAGYIDDSIEKKRIVGHQNEMLIDPILPSQVKIIDRNRSKFIRRAIKSELHSAKHHSLKTLTDERRMISTRPDPKNASFSIRDNRDSDSNMIEESDSHFQKPFSPKTSTDEGRMIAAKSVAMNATSPIRDNLDPVSNAIEESDSH